MKNNNSDNNIHLYNKEYLLTANDGGDDFKKGKVSERFLRILDLISFAQGDKILDLGAGRGEFGRLLQDKAQEIVLSDYSNEALQIIRENINSADNIKIKKINAKQIPYPNEYFDKVFLLEVIEHVYIDEANLILREIKRVLKKDGLLILSTGPNKYLSFPQYFIAGKVLKLKLKKYHLNEYSFFSLREILKNNFNNFEIYCFEEKSWFFNVIRHLDISRTFKKMVFLVNVLYDIKIFSCIRQKSFLKKIFAHNFLAIIKK